MNNADFRFSILSPWCYYQKIQIFKNFTRNITPWLKSRLLDILAMVIISRYYGISEC